MTVKPSEQFNAALAEVDRALEELPEEVRQSLNVEGLGFKELRAKCRPIMLAGQGRRQRRQVSRILKAWRDEWMAEIRRAKGRETEPRQQEEPRWPRSPLPRSSR